MIRKRHIAYMIFVVLVCYIISPWFFEKKLLFNELLSATGLFLFCYKRFKMGSDLISICILLLLAWGTVHLIVSLVRADSMYYYLRNTVIIYSVFTFFIGYYGYPYLSGFVRKFRTLLQVYIISFLFLPVSRFLFERFGMSTLFPSLFKKISNRWMLPALIFLNIIYAFTYASLTSSILACFYFFLLLVPGYRFFKQTCFLGFLVFACVFIYLIPNLSLIAVHYSYKNNSAIWQVIRSNPLLSIDGNSTWRLVLWKQVIIDKFPSNIFGMGFGTPLLRYFPIEDFTKVPSLPYIIGAHNSFVYLFGRLGIVYVILMIAIYRKVFKEYFYFKHYYYSSRGIFIFWSFFAITFIALFNPTLESPIFSGAYWFFLGLLARVIIKREQTIQSNPSK
ncbi:MAG: hypothetical protein ACJ75B_17315 [Flavisolibacter sp.]